MAVFSFFSAVLLSGCGGSAPVASRTGQPVGEPKVSKVVLALGALPAETIEVGSLTSSGTILMRPMYEYLLGLDTRTGKVAPHLAERWSVEPDGKAIRFALRRGVQFQRGYGEFTSADVDSSRRERFRDEYPIISMAYFRDSVSVEPVNPYEVLLRTPQPDGILLLNISEQVGILPMVSKRSTAEWERTTATAPVVGTGPYQFKSRETGVFTYERTPYKHWRTTPDFAEFEFRAMKEPSARLAALLVGEVHIADLPNDLMKQAGGSGMKRIPGTLPGLRQFLTFNCCYVKDPKNPSVGGYVFPDSPLMDLRVRKALSKAIDRDALSKAFFSGEAETMVMISHHPTRPGWNPDWQKRFADEYGYDPAKARALLAEAGYGPGKPLKTSVVLTGPDDVLEAISGQWRALGIEATLLNIDAARWNQLRLGVQADNHITMSTTSSDLWTGLANQGSLIRPPVRAFESPELDSVLRQIMVTVDESRQTDFFRRAGDVMFEQHSSVPLFWLPVAAAVNPAFVAGYDFPGSLTGVWTHVDSIQAVR